MDESVQGGHDEGEGDSANGAEEDDVVVSLHAPIITHSPEDARVYPKKLSVLSRCRDRT